MYKNQYIRLFAKIGDWYIVQTDNDYIGAVSSKYIKLIYPNTRKCLDAFEDILKDLGRGEKFDFELDKDKSFGEYDPKRVIELNKEMFTVDGHFDSKNIFKGAQIPLKNEDGNFFIAKVLEIGADKVKVDLNHPLAGNKLNFKGYVIENREATNDEIQTLLNHMNGGGCSGHCGGCENEGGCGHHDEKHSKEGGCCGHCH